MDIPYDIDPYITEIDTEVIDAEYLNSRFEKYLKVLNAVTATEEERNNVLEELHRSSASLSQEEQQFAAIFLHDVETGNVKLERGKSFKDYIVEYRTHAQNESIHQVAIDFGLDEEQLRMLMNTHITEENLNEFGRYDNIIKTADAAGKATLL